MIRRTADPTCEFGRKTCQWPWGQHVCAPHGAVYMEALNRAIAKRDAVRAPQRLTVIK